MTYNAYQFLILWINSLKLFLNILFLTKIAIQFKAKICDGLHSYLIIYLKLILNSICGINVNSLHQKL